MGKKQKKKVRIKSKSCHRKIKLGKLLISFAVLFYFVLFANAFFGQTAKTYTVSYGKIEESDNVEGYIIRKEKVITQNSTGLIKPVKFEGERVAKGVIVAKVFDEAAIDVEKKISEIDEKIQNALKDNDNRTVRKAIFSEDLNKIDIDTDEKIIELSKLNKQKNYERIYTLKDEINRNLINRAKISGEFGQADKYVNSLVNQKKSYEDRMLLMKQNIVANAPGVISFRIDGLEERLVPESIPTLTISKLQEIVGQRNDKKSQNINAVKVTDNFEAFICAIVENKERIRKLKEGKQLSIRLPDGRDELVPAKVVRIATEPDGRTLVIFSINKGVEGLLNERKIDLDIVWSSSKGLKVPLSTLTNGYFLTIKEKDIKKIEKLKTFELASIQLSNSQKKIPASINRIIKSGDSESEIEFKLYKEPANFLNNEYIDIYIDWENNKRAGLSNSYSAKTRIKEGVMVVDADYARFQDVEIYKRDNAYAIVNEATSMRDNGIKLYEEVLLNGPNFEEGRQIRKWEF